MLAQRQDSALLCPFPRAIRAGGIDFVIERDDLDERVRAVDLECGPETIAIPLSYSVAEVIALDPDPEVPQ